MSSTSPEYFLDNSMLGVTGMSGQELREEASKSSGLGQVQSFSDMDKAKALGYKDAETKASLDLAETVLKVQQGESGQDLANKLLVQIRGLHAMAMAQLQILMDKMLKEYLAAPARAEAEYRHQKTLMDQTIDELKSKHSAACVGFQKKEAELAGRLKSTEVASERLEAELTKTKEELAKSKEEVAKLLAGRNLLME